MSSIKENSTKIKEKALELGFSACGITKARKLTEEEDRLNHYLDQNYNGEMGYMANHFDKRLDPTLLVPGAKSIVMVLLNYFPHKLQTGKGTPIIAKYAYGQDYHFVIKQKLQDLLNFIDSEIAPVQGRIFTDTAPVLERAWAVQAGLGWIGKNGLLINKRLGSFFLIGELIIDTKLAYDQAYEKEYCGSCSQCIDACPTKALIKPFVLDARRCISYLTIELKKDIPEEFKPLLSGRAFGCDICQDVCPWNRKPTIHCTEELHPHPEFLDMNNEDWLSLQPDKFNELFRKSAIKRAGYNKLKMNISTLDQD